MKLLIAFVYILIVFYLICCIALFFVQRKAIYFPSAAADIPEFEHFILKGEGNTDIKIWKIPPSANAASSNSAESPALIYFGGNAEPVEYNLIPFQRKFPNHTVYLMNYRGYGGSGGKPTETGFYSDALDLFDSIKDQHKQVDVMGRSLGSGVASYLAIKRPINKLLLVTVYDSVESVASDKFRFFPVRFILKDRFRSILRAPKLTMPTLLITAETDKVIPRKYTENLWNALPKEHAQQVVIPDTDHNNILGHEDFFPIVQKFLAE